MIPRNTSSESSIHIHVLADLSVCINNYQQLFNFAADNLTKMVKIVQEKKLFSGLLEHIVPNVVTIL